uniref:Superoxide dismutase [Cu-Zn] n=1 Tax=Plectus sambesii TaxID=2011161 RepID=A0A914X8Y9_9BILA
MSATAKAYVFKAGALKEGDAPSLLGVVEFKEEGDEVKVTGAINGLSAGEHGFHVHQKGDLGDSCKNAAGHFNPEKKAHGGPDAKERHVGDLGNIKAEGDKATISIKDPMIKLSGPHSIVGRAIVIHEKADDLGLKDTEASRTTGDAGNRVACGVIAIVDE